mgnify:CR=1 FL=1
MTDEDAKKRRGESLRGRIQSPSKEEETDETEESAETSKESKTSKKSESEKGSERSQTVKERKNVNMYLPEDLVSDLQMRYSELNVQWRRKFDEDMPKNDQFYPAAVRAALEETSIESQLPIGDD